jgi:uncharacterized membrane protein
VKVRLLTVVVGTGLLATAGCGSVSEAKPEAAAKAIQLEVGPATLSSTTQLPGDRSTLSIQVKNTGSNPVNNLVVTLEGTQPDQLPVREESNPNDIPQGTDDLPNSVKRKAWFIDDGPGHAPLAGGTTWTGGKLAAGATTTLRWKLAAITPGRYTLKYWVAGGLSDNAVKATSGSGLKGTVSATIGVPGTAAPAN